MSRITLALLVSTLTFTSCTDQPAPGNNSRIEIEVPPRPVREREIMMESNRKYFIQKLNQSNLSPAELKAEHDLYRKLSETLDEKKSLLDDDNDLKKGAEWGEFARDFQSSMSLISARNKKNPDQNARFIKSELHSAIQAMFSDAISQNTSNYELSRKRLHQNLDIIQSRFTNTEKVNPTTEEVEPIQESEPPSPEELEEKAQARLRLAQRLVDQGKDASKLLSSLIKDYPETKAASEAEKLIKK